MAHRVISATDVEARHGRFRPLTEPLGVNTFRINQLEFPAGQGAPEHDHAGNGQEEVYAVIAGGGTLHAGGEEIPVRAGDFVYCSPGTRRQMTAGPDGMTWIGIGSAVAG